MTGTVHRPLEQPLTTLDPTLAEHLTAIGELDDEDRTAILRILDGLITKNRIRTALRAVE